jgi:WD40 repeat protein
MSSVICTIFCSISISAHHGRFASDPEFSFILDGKPADEIGQISVNEENSLAIYRSSSRISIVDLSKNAESARMRSAADENFQAVSWLPDAGQFLVHSSKRKNKICSLLDGEVSLQKAGVVERSMSTWASSVDGKLSIWKYSDESQIHIIDEWKQSIMTKVVATEVFDQCDYISDIAYNANRKRLLICGTRRSTEKIGTREVLSSVYVVDAITGKIIKRLTDHDGYVYHVAIANDGSLFATGCSFGRVNVYSSNDFSLVAHFKVGCEAVSTLSFSRDKCILYAGSLSVPDIFFSRRGMIESFDIKSLKRIDRFHFKQDSPSVIATQSDDRKIFVGTFSGRCLCLKID